MLKAGYSQKDIALVIVKDKSVLSREIIRNSYKRNGEYRYDLAHRKCLSRHQNKAKSIRFTPELKARVEELIRDDYSPEQVEGALKKNAEAYVSHERIYQHILGG